MKIKGQGGIKPNASGEDGSGTGSDVSALDACRAERFLQHAREMRMDQAGVGTNSVTIKHKRRGGKHRVIINRVNNDDVD